MNLGPYSVTIDESQRQHILLALAHLAIERPGWDAMLTETAMLLDTPESWKRRQQEALRDPSPRPTVPKGQPVMFSRFKAYHQATLEHADLQKRAQEACLKWINGYERDKATERHFQEGFVAGWNALLNQISSPPT